MTLPSISLVTPSLNQGRFLRATLESLLAQRYPALEVFVQDGGSTDETLRVLEDYRDRVGFVSEKDEGQADAINRGLSRVSGEVLGYLNSDDLLLPGALEVVGREFESKPELRFVYGAAVFVDETGGDIGPCLTQRWSRERLADYCFVAQPAAFFRRSLWEEIGPFDVSLHHTMDYDYWLRASRLLADSEVAYVEQPLAACRIHSDAKTVSGWDRALEEIFALVKRRTGYTSLWWCVAKWDHRLDGRSQATCPHPVPWTAYPLALLEFAARNGFRPSALRRGLRGATAGFRKRLRANSAGFLL